MAQNSISTGSRRTRRVDGRDRVLSALRWSGPLSRTELARQATLAPSTISALAADLLAEGLVVEAPGGTVPAAGPRGGRPATRLALHRSAGVVVGVDFGKRHARVAITDLGHTLLAERTRALDPDRPAAESIRAAGELVRQALAECASDPSHVVSVGMGIPGPVHRSGQVGDSSILPGWVGVQAAQAMTEELGLPTVAANDANLGALGEWMWGSARGYSEVAYLKASAGLGAGLIIGGHPFGGAGGTAGEIGHTVIDPAGPICRCGNRGCLEMLAGTAAVLDALRPTHGDTLTIVGATALARNGDTGARRAIADAGSAIGTALATLCNLINPQRIVESTLGDRAEVLGAVAFALRSNATALC